MEVYKAYTLQDAEQALTSHELKTTTRFCVCQCTKHFGENNLYDGKRRKILWSDLSKNHTCSDGAPFLVLGTKTLDCHHGKERHRKNFKLVANQANFVSPGLGTCRTMVSQIFRDHAVSDEAQAAIILLQLSQEKQQKSSTSNDRKDRILNLLFQNRRETLAKINLFRGLLSVFQDFVKCFQSESPLIHTLHSRMVEVTKELLGMFIKPENISDSVTALTKLDVSDRKLQKPDKDLFVGKFAYADMNKARMDSSCKHWVSTLYADLRNGYVKAAQKMLNLPLDNKTIRRLSVLDPGLASHSQASSAMKKLAKGLPNMFNEEELGQLAVEIDKYSVDRQVREIGQAFNESDRIDSGYWLKVFGLKNFDNQRFPLLKRMVTSLLTVFSGPLIESTFNIMDDIVEKDRTKLTVENYEAVAIVKTALKRKKVKSTKMTVTNTMAKTCITYSDVNI